VALRPDILLKLTGEAETSLKRRKENLAREGSKYSFLPLNMLSERPLAIYQEIQLFNFWKESVSCTSEVICNMQERGLENEWNLYVNDPSTKPVIEKGNLDCEIRRQSYPRL